MTKQELIREIEGIIEERLDAGDAAPMSWIVTATIRKLGDDEHASPFYRLTSSIGVQASVREALRQRKQEDDEEMAPRQSDLFPGFRRVQRSYTIERDGEQRVVPLLQMTAEEIHAKASELRAFARGAVEHAKELEDYLSSRMAA